MFVYWIRRTKSRHGSSVNCVGRSGGKSHSVFLIMHTLILFLDYCNGGGSDGPRGAKITATMGKKERHHGDSNSGRSIQSAQCYVGFVANHYTMAPLLKTNLF